MSFRKIVTDNEDIAKAMNQRQLAKDILNNPESQFILLAVTGDKKQACAFLTSDNVPSFLDLLLIATENTCP